MIPNASFATFKKKPTYQFVFEQDGIVSGIQYAKDLITPQKEEDTKCFFNFKDGDCVLKGQTGLEIFQKDPTIDIQEIVQVIGYLSGAATLTRCYVEACQRVDIVGSASLNPAISHWELEAIKQGGGKVEPQWPEQICSSKEQFPLFAKDSVIAFDSQIPLEDLKSLLKEVSPSTLTGVCGPLLPQDIKKWEELPIHVIWPSHLQGRFPSVKINLIQN